MNYIAQYNSWIHYNEFNVSRRHTPVDQEFRDQVGLALEQCRLRHGLSQAEFAEKLGTAPSTLSAYLSGDLTIGGDVLARACVELGLTFEYKNKEVSARDFQRNGKPPGLVSVPLQLSLSFDPPLQSANKYGELSQAKSSGSQLTINIRIAG
jgi:transcriptional regulator with XRE-family HTH domain